MTPPVGNIETKVQKSPSRSSFVVTIPDHVVKMVGLQAGDIFRWIICEEGILIQMFGERDAP